MVLTAVMMTVLLFFEFYMNLRYHVRSTPKSSRNSKLWVFIFPTSKWCVALSSIHCKIGNLLSVDSILNLTSHRSETSYTVILNGYLRGCIIRSNSRLFPPMLVHGSRPNCYEYHK
ncbi:hypothetical protein AMTRI_Chr05g56730 [Amborella trichopoda]